MNSCCFAKDRDFGRGGMLFLGPFFALVREPFYDSPPQLFFNEIADFLNQPMAVSPEIHTVVSLATPASSVDIPSQTTKYFVCEDILFIEYIPRVEQQCHETFVEENRWFLGGLS